MTSYTEYGPLHALTDAGYRAAQRAGYAAWNHGDDLAPFAGACMEDCNLSDVIDHANATSDEGDMLAWGIDAEEWHAAQGQAIEQAMWAYQAGL